jgi:putative phosphoesterase
VTVRPLSDPTATLRRATRFRCGVISDTHGLVRPEALAALRGLDAILHAGDVGGPDVLDALAALAPVTAVRGNNDRGAWARRLPLTAEVAAGGLRLLLLHDLQELAVDPAAAGYAAVVSGHSHRPGQQVRGGVLYLNPGSAGPRRFRLPVAVARIEVAGGRVSVEIVELALGAPAPARPAGGTAPRQPARGRRARR